MEGEKKERNMRLTKYLFRYHARRKATGYNDAFPGLESRKVDMTAYNTTSASPLDRRQLYYYRAIGDLPADANIHACAHLYASDRNSLFSVADFLSVDDKFTHMASLSHSVIFHSPVAQMLLQDPETKDKFWTCQEVWTTRAAVGRAIHNSRIIGRGGVHVASTLQEGVLRVGVGENKYEKAYKAYVERKSRQRL
jgi:acyl-CoA thioesterase II